MSLLDRARKDIQFITSDKKGFAETSTFTDPNTDTYEVNVIHTKHHLSLDPESGIPINAKVASIAFSESNIETSVRNAEDEVDLNGWMVAVPDSTGIIRDYYAREWFPDEMIGMIVVILSDAANA